MSQQNHPRKRTRRWMNAWRRQVRATAAAPWIEPLESRLLLSVIQWSGDLPAGTTTWATGDVMQVTGSVRVPAGSTLVIEPGVEVKFDSLRDLKLQVDGRLVADGTPQSPIVFTSMSDDTGLDGVLGTEDDSDTNGNGPSTGAPNQWEMIQFTARTGAPSIMNNVRVRFSGENVPAGIVTAGPLTITNSTIESSSAAGMRINESDPVISGVTFRNNVGAAISMDLSSNPTITAPTVVGNGINGVAPDGFASLSKDLVWDDPDIVYRLIGPLTVPQGRTLTIASGQVVKAAEGVSTEIFVDGTLIANGTAEAPIIFTSVRDDSVGGDTNNNGPSAGQVHDWEGLYFRGTSTGSVLNQIEVRFAGANTQGAITIEGAPLTLTSSVISSSATAGLRIINADPVVTGVTFRNSVGAAISMDLLSNPSITAPTLVNNAINAVALDGFSTLTKDAVWDDRDIVYRLFGPLTVPQGRTLTIAPGQVVKAAQNVSTEIFVNGTLVADGTADAPIIFTSARDDSVGGDTNNDGNSTGQFFDWQALRFRATSTNGLLNNVDIRFAGANVPGAVTVDGAPLTITNSVVRGSATSAVVAQNGAVVLVDSNTLADSAASGVRAESSATVTVTNNTITGNQFGLSAVSNATLTAVNNLITGSTNSGAFVGPAAVTLFNNTLSGNHYGVYVTGHVSTIYNNIIASSTIAGVQVETGSQMTVWGFNDAYNPGRPNYSGMADPTGSNGNVSVDPLFIDPAQDNYHLPVTSPLVDAGFGTGAPTSDHDGLPRHDEPGVPNTGGGTPTFVDIGAFEASSFVQLTTPDLYVTQVTGPAAVVQGQSIKVSWKVFNNSPIAASGAASWTDGVYLSTDATLSGDDTRVGQLVHSGGLAGLTAYSADLTVSTAGVLAGNYYILVWANDGHVLDEAGMNDNNTLASAQPVQTGVQVLTLDTPRAGTLTAGQAAQWYAVDVPANSRNLLLQLHDTDGAGKVVIYASFNRPPTTTGFQFSTDGRGLADPKLTVKAPAPGLWYVLVQSAGAIPSGAFMLTARTPELDLLKITPDHSGSSDPVVVNVTGVGFDPATSFTLVNAAGQPVAAASVSLLSSSQLTATFAAGALAAGGYTARVSRPDGASADLPGALSVTATGNPDLQVNLVVPSELGNHNPATIYLEYSNQGDAPLRAPLIFVSGERDGRHGAFLTLDPSRLVSGFWTSGVPEGFSHYVQVMASGETPGWLLPGESARVPIYYIGWEQPWTQNPFEFGAKVMPADATAVIDWPGFESEVRPASISDQAWGPIFDNFTASVGSTWGELVTVLDNAAAYLASIGHIVTDVRQLIGYELLRAQGVSPIATLAASMDISLDAPGLPLTFGRFFPQLISQRYKLGTLGYGWVNPWDSRLTLLTDGTAIVSGGGVQGVFQPDSRGGYFSLTPGNEQVLASLNGGGFKITDPDGRTTIFASNGSFVSIEDANGNRITATYNGGGRLTGLTHSAGPSIMFTYNASGRITALNDSLGNTTAFTYDAAGEHLLAATTDGRTTQYTYNIGGNPASLYALTSITSPDGSQVQYAYDGAGRLISSQQSGLPAPTTLDYSGSGEVAITDPDGQTTRFFLDETGQVAVIEDAMGRRASLELDSQTRPVTVTDSSGAVTRLSYSSTPRTTTATNALGHTTHFSFDIGTNTLRSFADPNGNVTLYDYDAHHNLTTLTDAAGHSTGYTYTASGLATTVTNRRGQTTSYQYDAQGHVTSMTLPNATPVTTTYNAHGLPATMTDATGVTTFTYDSHDQLTRIDYPGGLFLQYQYDALGRRSQIRDQTGQAVNYSFDAVGRLSRLTDGSGVTIVQYTYDTASRLSRRDLGNGGFTTYAYNGTGQVTRVANFGSTGDAVSRFDYAYDDRGTMTAMTTLEGRWDYGYDALGQLTHAAFASNNPAQTPNQNLNYTYDATGNRVQTSINGAKASYTTNNLNQYTQAGGATLTYDADGNLILRMDTSGAWTYSYDALNRLVGVQHGGDAWSYGYDAMGNRVTETHNGVTTRNLVDPTGLGNIVGQFTGPGNTPVAGYVYGLGLESRLDPAGGDTYYQFDAMGNTTELLGDAGAVLDQYRYLPFGQTQTARQSVANPFQFVGASGVVADATGLITMRARQYDPVLGRFVQQDPLGINAGANLYTYAGNAPVLASDPSGLMTMFELKLLRIALTQQGIFEGFTPGAARVLASIGNALDRAIVASRSGINPAVWEEVSRVVQVTRTAIPFGSSSGPITGVVTGVEVGGGAAAAEGVGATIGRGVIRFLGVPLVVATTIWTGAAAVTYGIGKATGSTFLVEVTGAMMDALSPSGWATAYDFYFGPSKLAQSNDPNEKLGPAGAGPRNFVSGSQALSYRVNFENDPAATAPAQLVRVTDQLAATLDPATFEFTEIGWGDTLIAVPVHSQQFQTVVNMTYAGEVFDVQVNARVNPTTGLIAVMYSSVDPSTGLPPSVSAGFLPPEDGTGRGMGHFSYIIKPKPGLADGTEIRNIASIIFDVNDPITTDQIDPHDASQGVDPNKQALTTIDATAPSSGVSPLPPIAAGAEFPVSWSGQDTAGSSGIAGYDVWVSTDGEPSVLWLALTQATTAMYDGEVGHTYGFHSRAVDKAGNREDAPDQPDATLQVVPLVATTLIPGKKHTFTDGNGSTVTVAYAGKVGTATLLRGVSDGAQGDLIAIELAGTDAKSKLTITGKGGSNNGQTTVIRISGNSPLGSLNAKTLNLDYDGILMTGQGYIASTLLHDVLHGADLVMPGVGATKGIGITLAGVNAGTEINSGSPIKTLTLADWSGGGLLAAPSVATLKVTGDKNKLRPLAGDFTADIHLTDAAVIKTLGAMTVAGTLLNARLQAAGYVGAVTLGAMSGSRMRVGTAQGVMGLAQGPADFVFTPTKPTLASLTIKGLAAGQPSLIGSIINAWNIGKASLKLVDTPQEGETTGFAANQIGLLAFLATGVNNNKPVKLSKLFNPSDLNDDKKNPSNVSFPIGVFNLQLV